MFSAHRAPDPWRQYFALADETAAAGGRMFIQVHSRALNIVLSFETVMPFDKLPVWHDIRTSPLAEQQAALRNPYIRRRRVGATLEPQQRLGSAGPDHRSPN